MCTLSECAETTPGNARTSCVSTRSGLGWTSPSSEMYPAFWISTGTSFSLQGGTVVTSFTTTRQDIESSPSIQHCKSFPFNFSVSLEKSILPWFSTRISWPMMASRGMSATTISWTTGSPANMTVRLITPSSGIWVPPTPVMCESTALRSSRLLSGSLWYTDGDMILIDAPVSTRK